MAELALIEEKYKPQLDENGNYIDKLPLKEHILRGIKCECSNNSYNTCAKLKTHFNTIRHKEWLSNMNHIKNNLHIENNNFHEVIKQQKEQIIEYQKKIIEYEITFKLLLNEITELKSNKEKIEELQINLIDF
jgi:predicted RNase H-like nuclease (RuvC/YqgF family)